MSSFEKIQSNSKGEGDLGSQALMYGSLGWQLLPCFGIENGKCNCGNPHNDSSSAGKHPIISEWPSKSTSESTQLKEWFNDTNQNNLALSCMGSGLVVVDIDPRNGGDESFLELEQWLEGAIPKTVTSLTGEYTIKGRKTRGRHLYFNAGSDSHFFKDFSKLGFKGIDIKFNGYVLLPPSKHISGVDYCWADGLSPFEISVADLSQEMREVMVKSKSKSQNLDHTVLSAYTFDTKSTLIATSAAKRELEKQVIRVTHQNIQGQRNVTLNEAAFVMGQYIAGGQISTNEVLEALTNAARIAFAGEDAESEISSVLRLTGGGLAAGALMPIYEASFLKTLTKTEVDSTDESEFLDKLNIVNWRDVWEDTSEEVWFVDGIICAERGHTIYSAPGVGKSLLVREMSACLATGKPVLGLSAKDPIKVLYIDHENIPKSDIRRSLINMGFSWEELEANFTLMSFPEFTPFDLPKGGQELRRALEILKPDLVVIDTLSRAVQGKENDNDTWIDFYNYSGKILKSMGIAYIRIDHTGKNSDAGPRGGSAKMGDVDLVWHLKEIVADKKFRLTNEKKRVPLSTVDYKISRELAPLRHQISSGEEWTLLFEQAEKHNKILIEISSFMEAHPKHPTGLSKLYDAMRSTCREIRVTRKQFDIARKEFLEIENFF